MSFTRQTKEKDPAKDSTAKQMNGILDFLKKELENSLQEKEDLQKYPAGMISGMMRYIDMEILATRNQIRNQEALMHNYKIRNLI